MICKDQGSKLTDDIGSIRMMKSVPTSDQQRAYKNLLVLQQYFSLSDVSDQNSETWPGHMSSTEIKKPIIQTAITTSAANDAMLKAVIFVPTLKMRR
jgi:hypothetical protein